MVTYSIPICNLNMATTLRDSLESILTQVNADYEVVVIDDGSDDGSLEILDQLCDEYGNLRYVVSSNDNLAEARNESFQISDGSYIIESIDSDDKYINIIDDFVHIFHQIEDVVDGYFYLDGYSINMAKKRLLLDYPYRSMGYGEDIDFRRRLLADERIIFLDHEPVCEQIGYDRSTGERIRVGFEETIAQFRGGIQPTSFVKWHLSHLNRESALKTFVSPIAYGIAKRRGIYDPPEDYETMGKLRKETQRRRKTIRELEQELDIDIDYNRLSELGRQVFKV